MLCTITYQFYDSLQEILFFNVCGMVGVPHIMYTTFKFYCFQYANETILRLSFSPICMVHNLALKDVKFRFFFKYQERRCFRQTAKAINSSQSLIMSIPTKKANQQKLRDRGHINRIIETLLCYEQLRSITFDVTYCITFRYSSHME